MNMKKQALFAAACGIALVTVLFPSCFLLPMEEIQYAVEVNGPPDYFFDDFEENDGDFSTRYYYKRAGSNKPALTQEYRHSSETAVAMTGETTFSVAIEFGESGSLSFWISDGSRMYLETDLNEVEDFQVYIDGVETTYAMQREDPDYWYQYFVDVEPGSHTVKFERKDTNGITDEESLYIDDICFTGFMEDAVPAEKEFYLEETPEFDWGDCADAQGYRIQVSALSDFSVCAVDDDTITESGYVPATDLSAGKKYYWRVRVLRNGRWEPWSLPRTFAVGGDFLSESFEEHDDIFSTANPWMFGDGFKPQITDRESFDGSYAAMFGGFKDGESSFYTRCLVEKQSVVSFYLYPSGWESYTGSLSFSVDETALEVEASYMKWTSFNTIVDAGDHTLTWGNTREDVYFDDYNIFIDRIELAEIGTFESDGFENNDGQDSLTFKWRYEGHSVSSLTNEDSHEGDWSMCIGPGGSDTIESHLVCYTGVSVPSVVSYWVYTPQSIGDFSVSIDDVLDHKHNGYHGWKQGVFHVGTGTRKISFSSDQYYSSYTVLIDDIRMRPCPSSYSDDSFETGDLSANEYYCDAEASTVINDGTAPHGAKVLRLEKPDSDYHENNCILPVYFENAVVVSFSAKVDYIGDSVIFLVDGVEESDISSTAWTASGSIPVDAGYHILKWQYYSGYSDPTEYGYIDNIVFTE